MINIAWVLRERPLIMSDFRGELGVWNDPKKLDVMGEWGVKNRRTSFMDDP